MRKPTRAAWLVNQLARGEEGDLAQALDLGEALSTAHREAAGDRLRELTRLRNQLIAALVAKAVSIGSRHGYSASETAREEVRETLTAALADGKLADLIRSGLLVQCVRASAFGPVDMLSPIPDVISLPASPRTAAEDEPAVGGPSQGRPTDSGVAQTEANVVRNGPDPTEVRAAERALVKAESAAENAELDYRRVSDELGRVEAERDEISAAVDELKEKLEHEQQRLMEAQSRLVSLGEQADRGEDAFREAREALEAARQRIRGLGLEP